MLPALCRLLQASVEKAPFTLALLASQGRVPLLGLNDVINATLRLANKDRVGWLLLQCLYQSRFASGPNTGEPANQMSRSHAVPRSRQGPYSHEKTGRVMELEISTF